MRKFIEYKTNHNIEIFSKKLLIWANQFKTVCCLNSNGFESNIPNCQTNNNQNSFQYIVAVDKINEIEINNNNPFLRLKELTDNTEDWLFGFLTYDLKNNIENLDSSNHDGIEMPLLHFFHPKYIFILDDNSIKIGFLENITNRGEIDAILNQIDLTPVYQTTKTENIRINQRIDKETYIEKINHIKSHIQYGDIYEMNFCQEFYTENFIDPVSTYFKLQEISPTPFATYYRLDDKYLLSASPERFLKRINNKIISQPIKGTIRRGNTKDEDELLKDKLRNDIKERSENVMIVDLVRNDLSKIARNGSVNVDELYGVYTFKQVHQLISTVSAEINDNECVVDIIKSTFPMGSMTGAPKVRAMEIIEEYEETKRGLYSGSVGYITPDRDFDFNVIIRSIIYNDSKKYLSFIVGGAITSKSEPEMEYDECLLKAKAIIEVLS